ncbi:MAG: hypothetical protein HZB26_20745 [Candidatus Hydrogenedentes bacterium]|nr:hypothetical protein [Candidatus Hydrogenedentota bacterium]
MLNNSALVIRSLCAVTLVLSLGAASNDPVRGIPLKPDPPLAIDGDLGDWTKVPNAIPVVNENQVVWGKGSWQTPQDLSGTVHLAWREEYLFLAVEVTDDKLHQSQRGGALWKGDHVELFLDTRPEQDPQRNTLGEGQFQIAFSPGNFLKTGDPLVDCAPEAHFYRPEGRSTEGIMVSSARAATGYLIEAAIPWKLLGIDHPAQGTPLRCEVGLSDTDTAEPQQETMMTTSSAEWTQTRSRFPLASLAGADGVPAPVVPEVTVLDDLTLKQGEKKTVTFNAPAAPPDRNAVLSLLARLDYAQVAGYSTALKLTLNGQSITGDRLLNKPLRAKSRGGAIYSMAGAELFSVFYSPDFTSPDTHPHYGLEDGLKACEFQLKLNGLLREGANTLEIEDAAPDAVQSPLVISKARFGFRVPPPPPKPKAGPPSGPLQRIEPRAVLKTDFTAKELADGKIEVAIGGEVFVVESQFSTPKPEWTTGSNTFFRLDRRVESQAEAIVVHDTFTNLTKENLPIIRRHQTALGDRRKGLWLAGLKQSGAGGGTSAPENPTTYATTAAHGLGFVALDDVSRIHVANFAAAGSVGVADNSLVVKPGASVTAEWAIVPTATPDYFEFINTTRRLFDANFTIPGGFAFLRTDPLTEKWTDQQIADFIHFKDARYVCASISYPMYNGYYSHGTSFQRVTHDNYKNGFERWRRLVPEAKLQVYFHCFLDVTEDAPERFPDARVMRPDGTQADYGKSIERIFCPTDKNSFGAAVAKNIDIIFDEIKSDGVYWDEHEYSRWMYHYGEPWDGCSADIDPQRMTITRLKSSVTLLSESWRLALAKRILAHGPLVGNGAPYTRAMAELKFPCFVETGSISNCTQAQLYSPIALGDHLTERNERDAYNVMLAALDFGCVYHWYGDMTVIPTHYTLTRYMYPITPMELHEGYIIGRERIITKVSGLYGWGDAAAHEVHVFDDAGREAEGFSAPQVTVDGKTYTELRIAEGWSAAIVRK